MSQITFELTDLEATILAHIALDPMDYIANLVEWQANLATDEIVEMEVQRMIADPATTTIPSDRNEILNAAVLVPAADRQ
jgi:hypothetical protein